MKPRRDSCKRTYDKLWCQSLPKYRCRYRGRRDWGKCCWWWYIGLPTCCQNFSEISPLLLPSALSSTSAKTCGVLQNNKKNECLVISKVCNCLVKWVSPESNPHASSRYLDQQPCQLLLCMRWKLRFIIISPPRTPSTSASIIPFVCFREDGRERQRGGELQRVDQQAVQGGPARPQLHRWVYLLICIGLKCIIWYTNINCIQLQAVNLVNSTSYCSSYTGGKLDVRSIHANEMPWFASSLKLRFVIKICNF